MSFSYAPTIHVESGDFNGHTLDVALRGSDWGFRGARKYGFHVREAIRVLKKARSYDAAILCTVGIEAFLVARLRRLICPRTTWIAADLLIPREGRLAALVGPWLKHLDGIACIRRGDIATLRERFGVPPQKCFFCFFPGDSALPASTYDEGYIYSAGAAHRDWPTLLRALGDLPFAARLSTSTDLSGQNPAPERIQLLPALPTEQGRDMAARASLVVLALEDTPLPSGPLVLLDAMAMGKAVVASDVNGTRDYVREGETVLLVPPGDAPALARAIEALMNDPTRRAQMGQAARADVRARFTTEAFLASVVGACEARAHDQSAQSSLPPKSH